MSNPGNFVWRRAGDLRYLEADIPEIGCSRLFFSTRLGGVSRGEWASLNLGYHVEDDPGAVRENWRRFGAACGFAPDHLVTIRQVHGTEVRLVTGDMITGSPFCAGEGDGLLTDGADTVIAILVADCVPVYLVDPVREAAALVHAGWRGTLGGIAAAAVEGMSGAYGTRPGDCFAALGPSIGPCCYRVGNDVADAFIKAFPRDQVIAGGEERRLDLWEANAAVLRGAGLRAERIFTSGLCTACRTDVFFSHRAEKGRTGRMAAVIAMKEREI